MAQSDAGPQPVPLIAAAAPSNPPAVPPAPPPDPHAVAVDALAAPRPDSMGLVAAAGGGFADTLWRGTPGATAQSLVGMLPHRYLVPAARHLAIRFLLSAAPVEQSPDGAGAMLEARIMALAALAAWDDALALIDFTPAETRSALLARTRITGLLAKGRVDAACGEATRFQDQADAAWAELQVLCQLASGQNSAAAVSLGLLREQGSDDKLFLWSADIAQGGDAPPPVDLAQAAGNGSLDPVVMMLLRRGGYLLPKAAVLVADPTTLLFAAQTAAAPPPEKPAVPEPPAKGAKGKGKKSAEKPARPIDQDELRLLTLERAADMGVVAPDVLRSAYGKATIDDASSSAESISIDTARSRAATYQLALAQTAPGSRAEVVARVIDLTRLKPAGMSPGVVTTALVYAPVVMGLPQTADLAWFAPTAVRVLAAADSIAGPSATAETTTARPWVELLQGSASASASHDSATALASVWPYIRLANPSAAPVTAEEFAAWQVTLPTDPARARLLRDNALDLLTAVGDGLPAADWQAAIVSASDGVVAGVTPSALLWNTLSQAERAGRIGETTALTLRFLGADGGSPAPIAVTKAIESLTIAGRNRDARAIAIELALERGL